MIGTVSRFKVNRLVGRRSRVPWAPALRELDGPVLVDLGRLRGGAPVDAVLAQWPVDTHRDHRAGSLLVLDCWRPRTFSLYFYEVMTGSQTQTFRPTHYVDITGSEKRKRDACFAHASQKPEEFYVMHAKMNEFRGMEAGVRYAEAFVHHSPSPLVALP